MAYEQLKLDNQVCFRLYTASRLVTQCYSPFFKKLDITYPQYLVLMLLWEQDNRIVNDITERLKLGTNTITPLLQRMEKLGLVARTRSQADSRQRIVSLTKKGKQLEGKAKDIPKCLLDNFTDSGLTIEDLTKLVPLLDKLITAI